MVDADDKHHRACEAWFTTADRLELVIPAPVIAEACYLIGRYCGPTVEAAFLGDLGRGAYGTVSQVFAEDLAPDEPTRLAIRRPAARRYRRLRYRHR